MRIELADTLGRDRLRAARALMDAAFAGDFADSDWANALGGVHAIALEGGRLIGHASLVPRRLWVGQEPVDAGYLEAVAVSPARQGLGVGTQLMRALEPAMRRHPLCAGSTGEHAFTTRLGWRRWAGPTRVLRGGVRVRTPDEDDGIIVWWPPGGPEVDRTATLTCAARPGDDG